MPKKKTRVAAALDRAKKNVTQEVLRQAMAELPQSTTMGEVIASMRTAGFAKDFDALNLREFLDALGKGASRGGARKSAGRKAGRSSRTKLNTRTTEGREQIDEAVSRFLTSKGSARAEQVRAAVGGSAAQVRQSLSRLMASRKVSRKGHKRATEYTWRTGGKARRKKAGS